MHPDKKIIAKTAKIIEKSRKGRKPYIPKIEIDWSELNDRNIFLNNVPKESKSIFGNLAPKTIPHKFSEEVSILTDARKPFGYQTSKGNVYWSSQSKIGDNYPTLFNGYVNSPGARIYDQYATAMGRRRDYRWPGLSDLYDSGSAYGFEDSVGNALIGFPIGDGIHATHFAPASLRGGRDLIKKLSTNEQPVVFTVTEDLVPMLQKLNYVDLGVIPQRFGNQIVQKTILINPGAKIENIQKGLSSFPEAPFDSNTLIDSLEKLGFQHKTKPSILIDMTKIPYK